MAILLPHSLMIHVPKTGGSWCRVVLRAAKLPTHEVGPNRHCGINAIHQHAKNRFSFGFVRNPLVWMQSRWAYTMRNSKERAVVGVPYWSTDFNDWVANIVEKHPRFVLRAMLTRLGYKESNGEWRPGKHVVGFVGKTEHLCDDLVEALQRASESFDERAIRRIAPQKVCSRGDYWRKRIQYRPDLRQRVIEVNRPIFELFGYKGS